MDHTVLGIAVSPRVNGNSDLLLREALGGAESAGARTEFLALRDLTIGPCTECNACRKTGCCRIEDDFQVVLQKMLDADRFIFATPIFFMSVAAQGKLLIDRCQCLWSRKYVLKEPLGADSGRPGCRVRRKRAGRALVIAVGGSRNRRMFESVRLTMKYYLDALGTGYYANLFVNQVDARGAVRKRPEVLKGALDLGRALVADGGPLPKKPLTVEFFESAGPERVVPDDDGA